MNDKINMPFKSYRFMVEMESPAGPTLVGSFINFSGIKMTTTMVAARVGSDPRGVKDSYPGITEYQHVTLSKGVIGDNDFINWLFRSTAPSEYLGPLGIDSYRNLIITAITDRGEKGMRWILKNAIPAGYELEPMDSSRSTVLCEKIEFAIAGVERHSGLTNTPSIDDTHRV